MCQLLLDKQNMGLRIGQSTIQSRRLRQARCYNRKKGPDRLLTPSDAWFTMTVCYLLNFGWMGDLSVNGGLYRVTKRQGQLIYLRVHE